MLYLHGGGYVIGSPHSHRLLAYNIAKAMDARVLVIDYRMAPEDPFPAAVDDAVAAWKWMLAQGGNPAKMAIMGDSAGGGLTVATQIALKNEGMLLPDFAMDGPGRNRRQCHYKGCRGPDDPA